MKNIIELAKKGKFVKVDFPHIRHVLMWETLSEWEGEKNSVCASVKKKIAVLEDMGFIPEIIDSGCFACWADHTFARINKIFHMNCHTTCPLKWTDKNGNSSDTCHDIYHAWVHASGEKKKKFARMIRDMPLKDEAELLYNIK